MHLASRYLILAARWVSSASSCQDAFIFGQLNLSRCVIFRQVAIYFLGNLNSICRSCQDVSSLGS